MSIENEFFEMLSELSAKGSLKHLVLIGSWVLVVYRENYRFGKFELITKDIDLLVKRPRGAIALT